MVLKKIEKGTGRNKKLAGIIIIALVILGAVIGFSLWKYTTSKVSFDKDKYYKIINKESGKVLAIGSYSSKDPDIMTQIAQDKETRYFFKIKDLGKRYFTITAKNTGKNLLSALDKADKKVKVQTAAKEDVPEQQWKIVRVKDDYCKIINKGTGDAMTVVNKGDKEIGETAYKGKDNQLWKIVEVREAPWKLAWSDEFNGDSIDKSTWGYEIGYIRNNELQYYTNRKENSYIENGNLVLEARKEEFDGFQYTSASLNTKNKKSWMYGKLEMRAKLPYGKGMWPAFWTMGTAGGWPSCGEIDIMEIIGGGFNDSIAYGTAHWDNMGHKSSGGSEYLKSGKFSDDYHTFSIEWNSEEIKWFLDNEQYFNVKINAQSAFEFRQAHYMLLNLAVGGSWPGNPDDSTVFPQKYYIDYVRVYQK